MRQPRKPLKKGHQVSLKVEVEANSQISVNFLLVYDSGSSGNNQFVYFTPQAVRVPREESSTSSLQHNPIIAGDPLYLQRR